jgi:hypothetical protein
VLCKIEERRQTYPAFRRAFTNETNVSSLFRLDALATEITSLFVDTGPSEMNLAVIRLKLHSTVLGLRDHFSVRTSLWGGRKALLRTVGRELSGVAASVKAAREALVNTDELPAFVDPSPANFWLNDRLAWEFPAILESN